MLLGRSAKRELIMTNEPILRFRTIAAVAILGGGLTLTACSSDSSDAGDKAAASGECKLGDTVDQPATKGGVPACADQPGVKTKSYPCHPPGGQGQGVWHQVVNTNGTVMYGKPGGKWVQAENAGQPEQDLVEQIGC
jgi:hypothetical protein